MFDLGGVIMDIEKDNCVRAFERIGLPDAASYFGEYSQQGPFAALEGGKIDARQFREQMHSLIPHRVTDREIDAAFIAFLTGIPVHRLEALRALRCRYGIYLLSNTNPIMWNSFIAEEFTKEGLRREDYFDGMVTSYAARSMKPAREIFDYAATNLDIEPSETLFLDDSKANCEAAVSYGWRAAHVAPGREFMDILKELNLA